MQGENENNLTCTDKINYFKEKLTLWGARIKKRTKLECLSGQNLQTGQNLADLILQILSLLSKNIEKHLQSLDASFLDWVRDPFVLSAFKSAELTVAEEDELMEIRNDRRLKLKHSSCDMASFWFVFRTESPITTSKVTETLILSVPRYLREADCSAMNTCRARTGRGFKHWT
jgi:hypothetical protein